MAASSANLSSSALSATNGHARSGRARAAGLGLLGIGLGLTELAAPAKVAGWVGARDTARARSVLRVFGVREIASGIGLLARPEAPERMWARVAGDVLDLALLGAVLSSPWSRKNRTVAALVAIAGITAIDALVAAELAPAQNAPRLLAKPVQVVQSITINRTPEELYAFWRKLENLPQFMAHLESVQTHGQRSTWRARSVAGVPLEWEAEITRDEPNESISWHSLPDATLKNRGIVRFARAPGDRGTELTVALEYSVPGGKVSAALSKLLGAEPGQQISADLRRLKQILETGEVMRSDASIHRGMHPARPSAKPFVPGKDGV